MQEFHKKEEREIEEATYVVMDMISAIVEKGDFDDAKVNEFDVCQKKYLIALNKVLRTLKYLKKS